MALPPDLSPAPTTTRRGTVDRPVLREIVGLGVATAGFTGLIVCAYLFDPLAGWAVLCTFLAGCGVGMIYDRGA